MTDLATLGLSINAKGVTEARSELRAFSAAAKDAEQAAGKMEKSVNVSGKGAETFARQTGLARHEMINLSRQVQDVGVSLVSGQSPFMVLAQQGTQVYDIFANSKGSIRGFGEQLAAIITPARLAAGGIVLAGAAAYGAWKYWKDFARALDDTARIAGTTSQSMAKLQAVASFKGIGNDEFADSAGRFSAAVYQAKNNMGGLVDVLRANGIPASKDFETNFGRVADLIQRANGDTQLQFSILRQVGLPATMQYVRFLEQGAEGLRRAKEEATAFGGAANDNMVAKAREFDEAWNRATTNFGMGLKRAAVAGMEALQKLSDLGTKGLMAAGVNVGMNLLKGGYGTPLRQNFDDFYAATGWNKRNAGELPKDPEAERQRNMILSQRIGLMGELASVNDKVRQKEAELAIANLNGVGLTKDQIKAIVDLTRVREEGALLGERAQLGLFNAEAQAKQAEAEVQVLLQRKIITLAEVSAAQRVYAKRIEETAKAAAIAGAALPELMRLQMQASDLRGQLDRFGTETASNIGNAFVDIVTGAKSAKDAFKNLGEQVLRSLAQMVIQMTIVAPIARSLQMILGGFMSPSSSGTGFSLTGTGGLYANGAAFSGGNVIPFARGGIVDRPTIFPMANGAGLMGEAGPEAIMPLARGSDGKLGVKSGGGGNVTVNVINAPAGTSADVKTLRDANGGMRIDVRLFGDLIAGEVARGDSPLNKAMEHTYGLDRTRGMSR